MRKIALLPIFVVTLSFNVLAKESNTSVEITSVRENGKKFSKSLVVENIKGKAIFEGDINLGYIEDLQNLIEPMGVIISGGHYRWTEGVVPYVISGSYSSSELTSINDAMSDIESVSGVRFVQRSNQTDYIDILRDYGCYSSVGRRGGRQVISLDNGCFFRQPTHELLHALGFWHEQSREDRNNYVDVWTANIEPGKEHNFNQHISDGNDIGHYDYDSIMHYFRTSFSKNGNPTITKKNDYNYGLGGYELSAEDISTLQLMYGSYAPVTMNVIPSMCFGQNELNWSSSTIASYYRIEQYSNDVGWTLKSTTESQQKFVNVNSDTQLRVKACDSNNKCSAASNVVIARYFSACF